MDFNSKIKKFRQAVENKSLSFSVNKKGKVQTTRWIKAQNNNQNL
jgi:hypothetical protein